MRHIAILTSAVILFGGLAYAPAWAKTPKECNAEYATNKAAIKGAGQKKKDFIAACKAGTETIPAGTAAAPAPAPAPTQTAAPAPAAPAPSAPVAPAPKRAQTRTAPPATGTMGANQFNSEAQATARCPGQTVVWVNTKSGVYHFAGNKNYGNTKAGAYMCEADATSANDRAAKNEKHP